MIYTFMFSRVISESVIKINALKIKINFDKICFILFCIQVLKWEDILAGSRNALDSLTFKQHISISWRSQQLCCAGEKLTILHECLIQNSRI